ncbi:hypothetical protein Hypma_006942 [Hypsizygus marmoreus]|uniref:Uncharacterized protein n=1 Tax=Hypsizygus marmoreus TaxID=39966 RepID=A0A369JTF3_HYPMA|nr:hypothetical protein Hypma_006942 [Hypsizygus marmoreus]
MSLPRRHTRSNTKDNKKVADAEDGAPGHGGGSGGRVEELPLKTSKKATTKRKAAPAAQQSQEPDAEDLDQDVDNEVERNKANALNDANNKSSAPGRPKPVPRKNRVNNPDDDNSFMSTRRGWRHSPPADHSTQELPVQKDAHIQDGNASGDDDSHDSPGGNQNGPQPQDSANSELASDPPSPRQRSSSPSGSDYEEAQRQLERIRPPTSRRGRTLTIEEQDQMDEERFEQQLYSKCLTRTAHTEDSSDDSSDDDTPVPMKQKGKQKHLMAHRPPAHAKDGTDEESGEDVPAPTKQKGKKKRSVVKKTRTGHAVEAGDKGDINMDEDEDEDSNASAAEGSKQKKKSKPIQKGKQRIVEEGDGESDEDKQDTTDHAFKPGPVPEAAKDAIFIAHADYQRRMQEIANEFKKPVSALYQLVGQALPVPRFSINGWNAFQVWYGVNGEETKPKSMSSAEWTKVLVEKYEEYLQDKLGDEWENPRARTECLQPLVDWYKGRLCDHVENTKIDGNLKRMLLQTTDKFIQYSTQAYEMYGIHVFGFAINTDRDEFGISHSTSWGGSPAFAALRQGHKASITTQLNDYEAMFRIEEMKAKGLDVAEEVFPVQKRKEDELNRDYERRVFKDGLVGDYGKILLSQGKLSAMAAKNLKMPWAGWADAAYEFKVCLINWPRGARAPARGFDIKSPECIPQSAIRDSNRLRRQAEVDDTVTDYVKVVPWSDDDLLLDIDDVAINDVPLVRNTDGRSLITVIDSLKFQKAAEKKKKEQQKGKPRAGAKTKKRKNMPKNLSSDEDDIQEIPPPLKKRRRDSRSNTSHGGNVDVNHDSIQDRVPARKKDHNNDPSTKSSRQRDLYDSDDDGREAGRPPKKHQHADTTSKALRRHNLDDEPGKESRPTRPEHMKAPASAIPDSATLERWARENGWTHDSS